MEKKLKKVFLRIDDIGASTKRYEVYSKTLIGNILSLKYHYPFKAWGPYEELTVEKWKSILEVLNKYNAKLTVGVTAAWVEEDGALVSFPEKFPEQSDLLKSASQQGVIEVANHGLTHCVVGHHLPRKFSSNRKFHREFWDWLPYSTHLEHIETSQKIFQDWLGHDPTTLIPPGNVFSMNTLKAVKESKINIINSYMSVAGDEEGVRIIDDSRIDAFHDREIELYGVGWLERKIKSYSDCEFCLINEI